MKRNTLQKQLVMDTLRALHCHASAGMVYDRLHQTHPTVSRSTVYRVLQEAADAGELLRLHFRDGDDRFDTTLPPHAHVICRRCGRVEDIDDSFSWTASLPRAAHGFTLDSWSIECSGLCPACRKETRQPPDDTAEL